MDGSAGERVIDTHVHVWDIDAPWMNWIVDRPGTWDVVRRTFTWADLRRQLDEAGVSELILVQASPHVAESRQLLDLAAGQSSVLGVVGWVTLRSGQETERDLALLDGAGAEKLVGIRNNHSWAPDGDILASPAALDSCRILAERGLPLDLHFPDYRTLHLARSLVERVPDNRYVIDHLGKPNIADPDAFKPWSQAMSALADNPQVFVKYSGWATFLGHAVSTDVKPYIDFALERFGPDRVMFGSNWPVALVAANYEHTYRASMDAIAGLTIADRQRVMAGTALRCYCD